MIIITMIYPRAMKLNNTFELTTTGSLATADAKTGLHVAKFTNTADGSGIAIQVGASTPHNNNNFITY